MTYAQQLLELKRKSKLSGQPISNQQTAALNQQNAATASGRLQTKGNIQTASSSLQDQLAAYSSLMAAQANTSGKGQAAAYSDLLTQQSTQLGELSNAYASLLAKQNSQAATPVKTATPTFTVPKVSAPTLDTTPLSNQLTGLQTKVDTLTTNQANANKPKAENPLLASTYKFPTTVTLAPSDPSLQGTPVTERPLATPYLAPAPTTPDTPAQVQYPTTQPAVGLSPMEKFYQMTFESPEDRAYAYQSSLRAQYDWLTANTTQGFGYGSLSEPGGR